MSFFAKPPVINGSSVYSSLNIQNSAKFGDNKLGFFGNLSGAQNDNGWCRKLESIRSFLDF